MHSLVPAARVIAFTSDARTVAGTGKTALFLFSVVVLMAGVEAVRGQSALDGFDPNANGTIRAVVAQPDGKVLIGGDFTTVSPNGGAAVARNHIARLNPDGTLDTVFNPNANDIVFAIAVQADGKVLVGGDFFGANSIGGQTRNRIARLDATTGLADSFDPNANLTVYSIAVAGSSVLLGGDFTTLSPNGGAAVSRRRLARVNSDGTLDTPFNPNANGPVYAMALQADGKILAGGDFFGATSIGGQTRNRIARLDAATGAADSFNPNASSTVYAIALQADGKILVGGDFNGANSIGAQTRNRIARLDPATGFADPFDPNANDIVDSITVQADGRILVGGFFNGASSMGGQTRNRIARLDATTLGSADSFNPNANSFIRSIAIQPDGRILAVGDFNGANSMGGQTRNRIARLEIDGRLDQTLDLGTVGLFVLATAMQPDGKILIGGTFTTVLGVPRNNIARLNTDGTLDAAFNPNANNDVHSIAVQVDGKVLVGGIFTNIGGQPRSRIARLDATTGLADSFNPNANIEVDAITVQADGKILVGGVFNGPNSIGGQTRNRIARLDANTGLADSFDPNANNQVFSIAVQADGKILAGGFFTNIGGQARNRIARLDASTGLADSFNPNANNAVFSIVVQLDGKILAGGDFNGATSIGGQARNRIARLDASTGLADSFNPNASDSVETIALQADGKILVGGAFNGANSIGGQARNRIARLDATTGLADSFDPNASNVVGSIAVQAAGKILAGGSFNGANGIGGQSRNAFARLSNGTGALQNLAVTQTTVTWTRGGSSPQFTRVTFESSTDNVNYTPLGNGTAAGNNWILTGLSFPTGLNFYVRARGYYPSGQTNGSESITESVRNAFISAPSPTPTPTATATATATPTATATATAAATATATATPTPTATGTPAPSATPTPTPSVTPGTFGNISTRLRVETADNVLIGGFIVTGTQPKKIIVRAIGPSLPLVGALADPFLELRNSSGGLIASNDNWRSAQEAEIIATGIPPGNDLESAIVATLPANNSAYTAIVRGMNNGTGIGVVEVYDLDLTVNSKLGNISTRGLVQTGDDVIIGGLIVVGQSPLRVIVRAIGPSLPVPGALGNPTLELHDGNGALVAVNDNWRTDQEAEIIATGIPPSNDLESAIVRNLIPGNYTAIVRGVNNTTGVALVEAFGLN